MAHLLNRVNRAEYAGALTALGAQSGDTVLELGFGGGYGVEKLLALGATVIGSEPAVAMRARAHRRFCWALAKGDLTIWPHAAEDLPEHTVARALSMNTVYFWRDVPEGFRRLRRMVTTRVVLGIAPPSHLREAGFHLEGFRIEPVEWYADHLTAAGFDTQIQRLTDAEADLLVASPQS